MDTKFTFLEQLEQDLQDAATREQDPRRAFVAAAPVDRRPSKRRTGSWGTIAAALVALLVVAGAIGALSQLGRDSGETSAGSAASVPAGASFTATGKAISAGSASRRAAENVPAPPQPADTVGANDSFTNPTLHGADIGYSADASGQAATGGQQTLAQDLSKIIRDGTITLVVPKGGFGTAFDDATGIAEAAGGFVLSSSISQENQGTLTMRIPSRKLDGAIVKLRSLGRLAELNLTGKDVTASYIDLKARLSVLQSQRELIVRLLHQSNTVSGQLSLSNRFSDVQTQIEQIQGQLNVLNDKVDLATLKVTLREEGIAAAPDATDVTHVSLGSAWDRAVQGFFGVVAAVVVGLGYLVPLLVVAGLILLVRRAVIRRRATS
jgi:hypothetical protein